MKPSNKQRGAAAKEVILILVFLIIVGYLTVIGLKSTFIETFSSGIGQGTASAASAKTTLTEFMRAQLLVGIGIGLFLTTWLIDIFGINKPRGQK